MEKQTIKEKKSYGPVTTKLRNWYYGLPANSLADTRQAIMTGCKINMYKWYNWLSGASTPTELEQEAINLIAGKEIF